MIDYNNNGYIDLNEIDEILSYMEVDYKNLMMYTVMERLKEMGIKQVDRDTFNAQIKIVSNETAFDDCEQAFYEMSQGKPYITEYDMRELMDQDSLSENDKVDFFNYLSKGKGNISKHEFKCYVMNK
eukprot:Mrub_09106.p1 GENE.Mrub_09106~~Mrub_09106.p1  ORF type:complete len:127 (-),score=29.93 Mrub_09106:103-483(-)